MIIPSSLQLHFVLSSLRPFSPRARLNVGNETRIKAYIQFFSPESCRQPKSTDQVIKPTSTTNVNQSNFNQIEPTFSSPVRHADREWLKISRWLAPLFPTGFSSIISKLDSIRVSFPAPKTALGFLLLRPSSRVRV